MADIGIIMSAPMVRALLDGRKTMTRRILKPQPERFLIDGNPAPISIIHVEGDRRPRVAVGRVITNQEVRYAPGDRLWVREGWRWNVDYHNTPAYRVDYPEDSEPPVPEAFYRWRSPIHMARRDSRLTLIVTATKIEPVYDISDDDVRAEGVTETDTSWLNAWRQLWESIHGPKHWESNPDVVALTFKVCQGNIDKLKEAGY
jgi:hypothetical protein